MLIIQKRQRVNVDSLYRLKMVKIACITLKIKYDRT